MNKIPNDIKIVFHCINCRKRIEPFIDKDGKLERMFMAMDETWSPIFNRPVIFNGLVWCITCVVFGGKL